MNVFKEIIDRLWRSYKSTILGLALSGALEIVGYFANGTMADIPPWVHIIAGLILAPLAAYKEKEVAKGDAIDFKPKGRVNLTVLLVMSAACFAVGCAWIHKTAAAVGPDEIDCAEAALKEAAMKLLPQVTLILSGAESPDWRQALDALKATGEDAVACAVAVVVKQLDSGTAEDGGPSPRSALMMPYPSDLAVLRGNQYLAAAPRRPVAP